MPNSFSTTVLNTSVNSSSFLPLVQREFLLYQSKFKNHSFVFTDGVCFLTSDFVPICLTLDMHDKYFDIFSINFSTTKENNLSLDSAYYTFEHVLNCLHTFRLDRWDISQQLIAKEENDTTNLVSFTQYLTTLLDRPKIDTSLIQYIDKPATSFLISPFGYITADTLYLCSQPGRLPEEEIDLIGLDFADLRSYLVDTLYADNFLTEDHNTFLESALSRYYCPEDYI